MKAIFQFLVISTLFIFFSCQEKELILPESQNSGDGVLDTRPSLRPDSVKAYSAFYHSVEIVYPIVQPDRAVKSMISYIDDNDVKVEILVTDFNQVVKINNLSLREYDFTIVYLNDEGIVSSPVVRRVTPYAELPSYVFNSLDGYGDFGVAYFHWDNITGKDIEVKVTYLANGSTKVVTKLSNLLKDTLRIEGLQNVDYDFEVIVNDPDIGASSAIKSFTINPGVSAQQFAANTLELVGGYGLAQLSWDNPSETNLRVTVSYDKAGTIVTEDFVSNDIEGGAVLGNIPEGTYLFSVKFTNISTGVESIIQSLNRSILKGVALSVIEGLSLKSFGTNLAYFQGVNNTGTSFDVKVSYEKASGGVFEETTQIVATEMIGSPQQFFIPLNDVKANAAITVSIIDDFNTENKVFNSTVQNANLLGTVLDRTGWVPTASSERAPGLVNQLLDGIFGAGTNNGWVNQWATPPAPADPITGTVSNVFPHYIQVDMLGIKYVTGIRTINHSQSPQNGAGEFIVQYSIDGINYQDAQTYSRLPLTAVNQSLIYVLNTPVLARYVRYFAVRRDNTATNVIRMAEFYVNGLE